MHHNNVEVRLAPFNHRGRIIEYENFYLNEATARIESFSSRLIAVKYEKTVSIHLTFDKGFDFHGATGIAVQIQGEAQNPYMDRKAFDCKQLLWIEKSDADSGFVFSGVMVFNTAFPTTCQLMIARRSSLDKARNAWKKRSPKTVTDPNCFTIVLRRGSLRIPSKDERRGDENGPSLKQHHSMPAPKPIRREWFTPLPGEPGERIMFEFRNMGEKELCKAPENQRMINQSSQSSSKETDRQITQKLQQIPKQPTKRARYDDLESPNGRPLKLRISDKSKAAFLPYEDDEDDQDDEETLPRYSPKAGVKTEDDEDDVQIISASEIQPRVEQKTRRDLTSSNTPNEPKLSYREAAVKQEAAQKSSANTRGLPDAGLDEDDELLKLQLEENRILLDGNRLQQQIRKKKLQHKTK